MNNNIYEERTCCDFSKNLIPIIYKYTGKTGHDYYGVDYFVCATCMSNICVDDSYDRRASHYKNIEEYIHSETLRKFGVNLL